MVEEIWKDIEEFKGKYQVSNMGRVRSVTRFAYTRTYPSKIMKEYCRNNDNVQVRLRNGKSQVSRSVAKLVLLTFVGKPPKMAKQAKHLDGNPRNNRLENLEWDVTSAYYLPKNEMARETFDKEAEKCVNDYIYKHYGRDLLNWKFADIDDFKQICLMSIWNYIDLYDGRYPFYAFCGKKIDWCYKRWMEKMIRKEKNIKYMEDMVSEEKPIDYFIEFGVYDTYDFGECL